MNGSRLTIGAYGTEVNTLHEKLTKHGFDIPASEVSRGFFGPGTRQALHQYQREPGRPVTGPVDEFTGAGFEGPVAASGVSPTAMSSEKTITAPASQVGLFATPTRNPAGDEASPKLAPTGSAVF